MNTKDAYTLLEMLMDGVNPVTGMYRDRQVLEVEL